MIQSLSKFFPNTDSYIYIETQSKGVYKAILNASIPHLSQCLIQLHIYYSKTLTPTTVR